MHTLDRDADRLRAQGLVSAGPHGITEWREQDASQQQDGGDGESEREQEIGAAVVERRGRPYPDDSIGTAGEFLPLENDRPHDLREGKREHGKVNARQPHREPPYLQRTDRSSAWRREKRGRHGPREPFDQKRRPVGAETEIS